MLTYSTTSITFSYNHPSPNNYTCGWGPLLCTAKWVPQWFIINYVFWWHNNNNNIVRDAIFGYPDLHPQKTWPWFSSQSQRINIILLDIYNALPCHIKMGMWTQWGTTPPCHVKMETTQCRGGIPLPVVSKCNNPTRRVVLKWERGGIPLPDMSKWEQHDKER